MSSLSDRALGSCSDTALITASPALAYTPIALLKTAIGCMELTRNAAGKGCRHLRQSMNDGAQEQNRPAPPLKQSTDCSLQHLNCLKHDLASIGLLPRWFGCC